jgi:hypothetical protein
LSSQITGSTPTDVLIPTVSAFNTKMIADADEAKQRYQEFELSIAKLREQHQEEIRYDVYFD